MAGLLRRLLILLGGLPGSAWLGRRVFAWLDAVLGTSPLAPSRLTAMPLCILTTVGRRSGTARAVPLWQIPGDRASTSVVVATNFGGRDHPDWSYNLDAEPQAIVECNGSIDAVRARRVSDEEFARYWPRFVAIWPHYERYRASTDRSVRMYLLERQH